MKYKLLLLFNLLLHSVNVKAQNLFIKLSNSSKSPIKIAYLKVYCSSSDKIIDYYVTRNSTFTINDKNTCTGIKLEITAPGYQDYVRNIQPTVTINDTLSFVLSELNIKDLQPVVVTGQSRPILQKNDTTIYKAKTFSDGTEQKLNDILEKLPGIEVNKKSGEIKFKGKPIETILLEGDNLFGANYTLGSKNINASIVTEVQAIENFSENYVIKGLEKEEKVALNIKVTKTKMKISGNSELGLGTQGRNREVASDINANLLGLGQMHKFFTTATFNNIGLNKSPVDYSGNNYSIEQLKDKKYTAQKFIYEPAFSAGTDKNYSNINAQLFGNNNSLLKVTSKITLKGNIYFINDNISNQQTFTNDYAATNNTIKTIDLTTGGKKPWSLKGDLNLRYAISSKALLEILFSEAKDEIETNRTTNSNFIPLYKTELISKDHFKKLITTYSHRISKTQALQIEARITNNNINQNYNVSPSVLKRNLFTRDKQVSNYERFYSHVTATLLGKKNKTSYSIYIKFINDRNNYKSGILNSDNNQSVISAVNDIIYAKPSLGAGGTITLDFGKLKVTALNNFTYLHQQWENTTNGTKLSKSNSILEPALKLKYILTRMSNLTLNYSLNYKNINDQFLYPEIVIQNFRNVTNNKADLSLIKTNTITLNYSRSDLFNQLDNGMGITLQTNDRDYIPTYNITDTLLYTTFRMENLTNSVLDIHAYINKYIPDIKSSVKLSLSNTTNYYNNFLIPGMLRNNVYNSTIAVLFYKSIFKGTINFENENTFILNNTWGSFAEQDANFSYSSNSKVVFNSKKTIRMFVASDYFFPNLKTNKSNLFLHFTLSYKPTKKNFETRFIINNITNTLNYLQYQISDFSTSAFRINTLPRCFLIYTSFQF